MLKDKVAAIETPDPARVRFKLKQPWPDFITFYGTPATGAGLGGPQEVRREGGRGGLQETPYRRRARIASSRSIPASSSCSKRSTATGARRPA